MELDDLKSAWNKYSSENEQKQQVSEKVLGKMLEKRTRDITQKIGRNIRIGIGIVIAWICFGVISDFVLSPMLERVAETPYLTEEVMLVAFFVDIFIYLLIFLAIIIFWIRYNKIEKQEIDLSDLSATLKRIIGIINSYRKMFYVILIILIIFLVASFTTGYVMDYNYKVSELGMSFSGLTYWIIVIVSFLFVLGVLIGVYVLLFNLFFKRLYGRYLKVLKKTLKEMEEMTS